MPAIFAKILKPVLPFILDWARKYIWAFIQRVIAAWKAERANRAKNAAAREKTEKAVTKEEREDAARTSTDSF